MDQIRLGRISSLNYQNGTARVVYKDRDNTVTAELPLLSFTYYMPRVDDPVLVLHMPNGPEAGLVLGRYWCKENMPPEPGKDFFRMDLDRAGECIIRHKEGGVLEIYSPNGVHVVGDTVIKGHLTVEKNTVVQGSATVMQGLNAYGTSADGTEGAKISKLTVDQTIHADGDITAGSISLKSHTHGGVQSGSGSTGSPQ